MKIIFPEDPIKQEMFEALIKVLKSEAPDQLINTALSIIILVEKITKEEILEVLKW